jgi:phosphatidylserine/phosphatidylglycerophosphate/cardiolipin synthase-like enzyme
LAIALSVQAVRGSAADNDRQHFAEPATFQACFTPGDDCEGKIERTINAAARRIHLQAYLFADGNIAHVLEARRRGLEVIVLLDKRQRHDPASFASELVQTGVKVIFDDRPRIAHNKTIVIDPDGRTRLSRPEATISRTAPSARNAENAVIVRDDPAFAAAYERYFQARLAVASP